MTYTSHELDQGSDAWHAFRADHFGASEAAAMLGLSKYKTRDELLQEKVTGVIKEVNGLTQRIFDRGHEVEALARPIVEKMIGEELSPITLSDGDLSCSCDGLTFSDEIAWEHKQFNQALFASLIAKNLPEEYMPQCQQVLMISGADKLIFTVSDGTLENMAHYEVQPDAKWQRRIRDGWAQFKKDMKTCQPVEVIEMPKAEVVIDLPTLFVHAKGEITEHNMAAFGLALTNKLAEIRAIKLVDDQDFSNAKEAAKKFRETAKAIASSKLQMLAQTDTIGEAAAKMDAWVKDLNATALQLEKDVEREDLTKKRAMVAETALAYSAHVEELEAETRPIQLSVVRPDFAQAIKGKSKYASMQSALNDALATGKMEADAQAKDIRAKLAWCKETSAGFGFLFNDLAQIIVKPMDDFQLLVTSRIEAHKKSESEKVEAQRVAMQAAADAKAKAEADAILAEERAKAEAEQQAAVAAGVKAQLEAQAEALNKAAIDARNAAPNKLVGEAIEQSMKDSVTTGTGILKTNGQKIESITPASIYVPSSRPNRAELLDAVSYHFEVDNQTALEWLRDEFDPKVHAHEKGRV